MSDHQALTLQKNAPSKNLNLNLQIEKSLTLSKSKSIKYERKSFKKKQEANNDRFQFRLEKMDIPQWKQHQIKKIFQFYQQNGTHWSQLEKQLQGRNQNSLKNKFYGTLKFLLRNIFKQSGLSTGYKIRNLSATKVIEIYDGKKEYKQYKGLLKQLLQKMEYQVSRKLILQFNEKYEKAVNQIYKITFQKEESSSNSEALQNRTSTIKSAQQRVRFANPNLSPCIYPPFYSFGRPHAIPMINNTINQLQYPFWSVRIAIPGFPYQ